MRENIIVGVDIGSANTRAVVAQEVSDLEYPRVIGIGIVPSVGIRRGVVFDVEEAVKVINEAVEKAEKMAGVVVRSANVSIGGAEIFFQQSKGVVAVGKADGEVAEEDLNRAIEEAQTFSMPMNREIIHVIPQYYRLDDQDNIKDPLGMKGVRLEVNALIIEGSLAHVKNLKKCVYQSGIEIDELVLKPLASAESTLSKKQKELGVVLVDIGGGTTSLAVYEEGELIHAAIIPIGAGHITNDIAIGLRTSIEVAEKVKLEYGWAITEGIGKKEEIDLSRVDAQESGFVSRFHVAEIVEARLEEIFDLINKELKFIGKAGLLPAGLVFTGGGSKLPQLLELAKNTIGLPAQIGYPIRLGGLMNQVDDPSFASVLGLLIWNKDREINFGGEFSKKKKIFENFSKGAGSTAKKLNKWIEKFLP